MEVFNKIYSQVSSSVSTTVSQLSGVLPGNPVTREFDASTHIASGGPGLLWKIYKGVKRSTKQEAAIFVFEKRQLEKWNKTDREIILESLKHGVIQLTKIRHPKVLTVQHPLEESRESLAFATEPVFASLANILGQTFNMPQPTNLSDYKLFDVEIKYGLMQISEGLTFLHNDVRLLHRNICPESIIINQQGAWKIFGFDFCVLSTSAPNNEAVYPFVDYSPTLPDVSQPNLDYMAPECVTSQKYSTASDIFSLGMLVYSLHSQGGKTVSPVKDLQQFKTRIRQLNQITGNKLMCVPDAMKEYVKMMLNVAPEVRPDAHQFIKIPYFEDVGVKTLNYLDSLLQWDNLQKSQFFKGLPETLSKLPHRVKVQRVLPCLVRDFTQSAMVPFVLPSIFLIAENCTQKEYVDHVLPHLIPVMKLQEPMQILLIMLQKMEILLKLTPTQDVQRHVLPMLYRGLDSNVPQVHELCLSVLPTFAGLLDHANVKNSLLPRIKKLCLSTTTLSVRVNCLLCVGRLLEHLDKWLVLDEILPFLPQIPSREPAVLMGILGIYKLTLNHKKLGINKEIIATRILPFLIPLCIENGLSLAQFNALVALVKQMFQTVETEHRSKLEQLNNIHEQQKVLEATMPTVVSPNMDPSELDSAFSGLGLERYTSNALTVQDKQQVTHQNAFKNEQILTPKPIEPVKQSIRPCDQTFTLLGQNNANLITCAPVANAPAVSTTPTFSTNVSNIQHVSNRPLLGTNTTSPVQQNAFNNFNMGTNWNNQSYSWQSPNNNFNQWSTSATLSSNSQNQNFTSSHRFTEQNWTVLDNLLPTSVLKSAASPSVNTNNLRTTSSSMKKSLNNEDLLDLLS